MNADGVDVRARPRQRGEGGLGQGADHRPVGGLGQGGGTVPRRGAQGQAAQPQGQLPIVERGHAQGVRRPQVCGHLGGGRPGCGVELGDQLARGAAVVGQSASGGELGDPGQAQRHRPVGVPAIGCCRLVAEPDPALDVQRQEGQPHGRLETFGVEAPIGLEGQHVHRGAGRRGEQLQLQRVVGGESQGEGAGLPAQFRHAPGQRAVGGEGVAVRERGQRRQRLDADGPRHA